MPCYHPLSAWRGPFLKSGKRSVVFKRNDADAALEPFELKLPCGQCVGCRLERSRQWAIRCMHEASLYDRNCFLTLTFDRAHLPVDGSLSVRTFQLFMKKLRRAYAGSNIRFFHCGEYGERLGRPHYHACIFNFDFPDKYLWSVRDEFRYYRSPSLEKIWSHGFALISDVTFESAAYVARYIMKKVTGVSADGHYQGLKPEYVTMSRRPGIGKKWFDKFKDDLYPHDYALVRGMKVRPPKFYDSQYEISDPEEFKKVKQARVSRATVMVPAFNDVLRKVQLIDDNGSDRLAVKEVCKLASVKSLIRPLEVNQ